MAEEILEKKGEQETVLQTQETKPDVPETLEGLQGRLTAMEGERNDALKQKDEAQDLIGRHTEELSQLRNDNAFYRSQGNQAQQVQPQQVYPQNPGVQTPMGSPAGSTETETYDMYDEASAKRFHAQQRQETVAAVNAQLTQFAAYNQQTQVGAALHRGQQIIRENPEYFKGVEEKTANMVSNLARSGNIQPDLIENPTTWFGCADMVKGEEARKNPAQVTPVASTAIDAPAPVRSNEPEKQVDTSISKEIVDTFFDGNREEATKSAREAAAEEEGR